MAEQLANYLAEEVGDNMNTTDVYEVSQAMDITTGSYRYYYTGAEELLR